MDFGLVLPSGLKFTVFFQVPFSSMITFVFIYVTSPTRACVGDGGLHENWPCCTVIGEDVKLFKKILKLFFLCVFVFFPVF